MVADCRAALVFSTRLPSVLVVFLVVYDFAGWRKRRRNGTAGTGRGCARLFAMADLSQSWRSRPDLPMCQAARSEMLWIARQRCVSV